MIISLRMGKASETVMKGTDFVFLNNTAEINIYIYEPF
jgi:hypothetical protein